MGPAARAGRVPSPLGPCRLRGHLAGRRSPTSWPPPAGAVAGRPARSDAPGGGLHQPPRGEPGSRGGAHPGRGALDGSRRCVVRVSSPGRRSPAGPGPASAGAPPTRCGRHHRPAGSCGAFPFGPDRRREGVPREPAVRGALLGPCGHRARDGPIVHVARTLPPSRSDATVGWAPLHDHRHGPNPRRLGSTRTGYPTPRRRARTGPTRSDGWGGPESNPSPTGWHHATGSRTEHHHPAGHPGLATRQPAAGRADHRCWGCGPPFECTRHLEAGPTDGVSRSYRRSQPA